MENKRLILRDVHYTYQNGRDFRFKDLSLEITQNTITCVLGRNGVGKTTLLLLILGFLQPSSGSIVYPHDGKQNGPERNRHQIAYLPQIETAPPSMIVNDYLMMGRIPFISPFMVPEEIDMEKVGKAEEMLGISHLSQIELGKISGGELQRVRIGRALVQESEIILLDEPITHLDINAKFAMMELIKELRSLGKTVIFTTHDPVEALRVSDFALLIHDNHQIDFGHTPEVINSGNLSKCFKIPIKIIHDGAGYSCMVDKKL